MNRPLLPFWKKLPRSLKDVLAERCGTTYHQLNNIAYGVKTCSPKIAVALERETAGLVTCEEMHPGVDWAYLRIHGAVRRKKKDTK